MKTLFLSIIIFFAALANAAPPAPPACYPAEVGGTGTRVTIDIAYTDDKPTPVRMDVAWWYCPDELNYYTSRALLMCYHDMLAACLIDTIWASITANKAVSTAQLNNAWSASVAINVLEDPTYRWALTKLQPKIDASKPTDPVYKVAKNGTYQTRPTKLYVPASASAPAMPGATVGTVPVGAPCDCRRRVTYSKTLYCAVDPEKTLLAVCAKQ